MAIECPYTSMATQARIHKECILLLLECIGEYMQGTVFPSCIFTLVDNLLIIEIAKKIREIFMELVLLFWTKWWHGIEIQVIFKLEHELSSPSIRCDPLVDRVM